MTRSPLSELPPLRSNLRSISDQTREIRAYRARVRAASKRTMRDKATDVTEQRLRERDELIKGR